MWFITRGNFSQRVSHFDCSTDSDSLLLDKERNWSEKFLLMLRAIKGIVFPRCRISEGMVSRPPKGKGFTALFYVSYQVSPKIPLTLTYTPWSVTDNFTLPFLLSRDSWFKAHGVSFFHILIYNLKLFSCVTSWSIKGFPSLSETRVFSSENFNAYVRIIQPVITREQSFPNIEIINVTMMQYLEWTCIIIVLWKKKGYNCNNQSQNVRNYTLRMQLKFITRF